MPDLTLLREMPLDDLRQRLVELGEEQRVCRALLTVRARLERERERRREWDRGERRREWDRGERQAETAATAK